MAKLNKTQVNKLITATRTAIGNADKAQLPVADLFAQLFNGHARYIETSADFREFWKDTVGVSADTFKLARNARQSLMIATPDATLQQHLVMTGASIGTVSQERNALQDSGKVAFSAVAGAGGRPRTEDTRSDVEVKRDRTARLLKSLPTEMQDEVVGSALTRSPEKRTDITENVPESADVRNTRLVAELAELSDKDFAMVMVAAQAKRADSVSPESRAAQSDVSTPVHPAAKVTQLPKQRAPKQSATRKTSRKPVPVS